MRFLRTLSFLTLILLFGVIYGIIQTSDYQEVVPLKEEKVETQVIKRDENQEPNAFSEAANQLDHVVTKTFSSLLKGLD